MGKDVIIACDFKDKEETFRFINNFEDGQLYLKIGMELYYSEGPDIVRSIKDRGHKIFLDLKLCDIPNTVRQAMRVLSRLDVDMINLHAFGTISMMEAAIEGITRPDGTRPLLIAVTMLTSTSEARMRRDIMINDPLEKVVMHYANNAKEAGLDGVVCSPLEATRVHSSCGREFLTVTPGIRFEENEKGDQVRVTTPSKARALGADYIVVGRPITRAQDPLAAYRRCVEDFIGYR